MPRFRPSKHVCLSYHNRAKLYHTVETGSSPTQLISSRRSMEFSSRRGKSEGRQTDQDDPEIFFQARENSITSPNDDANATEESSARILGLVSLDPAPPAATAAQTSVVPPPSWSGQAVEDAIWGAGHVCLRLRPDKLAEERDRDSPEGRSTGDDGSGFGSEADEVRTLSISRTFPCSVWTHKNLLTEPTTLPQASLPLALHVSDCCLKLVGFTAIILYVRATKVTLLGSETSTPLMEISSKRVFLPMRHRIVSLFQRS